MLLLVAFVEADEALDEAELALMAPVPRATPLVVVARVVAEPVPRATPLLYGF